MIDRNFAAASLAAFAIASVGLILISGVAGAQGQDTDVETPVRIAAHRMGDGCIRFDLRIQDTMGEWTESETPRAHQVDPASVIRRWLVSSSLILAVDVAGSARLVRSELYAPEFAPDAVARAHPATVAFSPPASSPPPDLLGSVLTSITFRATTVSTSSDPVSPEHASGRRRTVTESGEARRYVLERAEAGEDGLQSFVEDRAQDPLDVAVGLRLAGADEALPSAEPLYSLAELARAEL